MTEPEINERAVGEYLREHPDFFDRHGELLATLALSHRHGGGAISLQERQLEVLREKHRMVELRLAELIHNGQENDATAEKLHRWTRQLLLSDARRLADAVGDGLRTVFGLPHVALRLWGLREEHSDKEFARPVPVDVITLANSMKHPYCGANSDFQAAAWLPEGGRGTRSVALLPLRKASDPLAFGLLVLGSPDPERFQTGMGTAFLDRIADTASAALSRLVT